MDVGLETVQIICIWCWQHNPKAFDPNRMIRGCIAAGCIVTKCVTVDKCHDLRVGTVIKYPAIWFAFFFAFTRQGAANDWCNLGQSRRRTGQFYARKGMGGTALKSLLSLVDHGNHVVIGLPRIVVIGENSMVHQDHVFRIEIF